MVLGNDLMDDYGISVLYSKRVLAVGNGYAPLHQKYLDGGINSIVLASDVNIGPQEEAVLSGELDDPLCDFVNVPALLLEPNANAEQRYSILVGRTLAKGAHKGLPVLVTNLCNKAITLKQGTNLATVSAVNPFKQVVFAVAESELKEDKPSTKGSDQAIGNNTMNLSSEQKKSLSKMIKEFDDIFSSGADDLGRTNIVTHEIDTGNAHPIRQPPRRLPAMELEDVNQEVQRMIKAGITKPSQSPWASPIVVVKKKDGSMRLCVDYRKLNGVTQKDAHPLPRSYDLFDTLAGSKYFSTLDLASGYHQVEVDVDDQAKTAFVTPRGLYEFKMMPFGLCNAPATFQRLMTIIFAGEMGNTYSLRRNFCRTSRKTATSIYSVERRKSKVKTFKLPFC